MTKEDKDRFNRRYELAMEATFERQRELDAEKQLEIDSYLSTIKTNKINKNISIINLIFVFINILLTVLLIYMSLNS
jgi:hypothetical protein